MIYIIQQLRMIQITYKIMLNESGGWGWYIVEPKGYISVIEGTVVYIVQPWATHAVYYASTRHCLNKNLNHPTSPRSVCMQITCTYCTTCPSERVGGERLGESNLCKTMAGAVIVHCMSGPWLYTPA